MNNFNLWKIFITEAGYEGENWTKLTYILKPANILSVINIIKNDPNHQKFPALNNTIRFTEDNFMDFDEVYENLTNSMSGKEGVVIVPMPILEPDSPQDLEPVLPQNLESEPQELLQPSNPELALSHTPQPEAEAETELESKAESEAEAETEPEPEAELNLFSNNSDSQSPNQVGSGSELKSESNIFKKSAKSNLQLENISRQKLNYLEMENTYLGLLKLQEKYRENDKILQYLQILKLSYKNKSLIREIYPNYENLVSEAMEVLKKI